MSTVRKVQRTPGGTFFITVPKSWAEQYGLKRGSIVAVDDASNGKLMIDAKHGTSPAPRSVTLKIGAHLGRELIGEYLLGFDVIHVESKNRVTPEARDTVKSVVDRLIGLEIVEEDYSRIVLQSLLEPTGFPPEKILRRGYSIVAGMHRDAVNALIDGDLPLAKNVMARDDEGNRLYFLLVRILRTIVQNPSLSEKLGVTPIECLDYRLVASLVEGIGDECVRIAQTAVEMKGMKLSDELKKMLVDLHALCYEAHENALEAFLTSNIDMAESVRAKTDRVSKAFVGIEKIAKAESLSIVPQVLAVSSFLREIYDHSVDLSDLVIPKGV
jgi:phosphate uptake regulator